MGKIQKNNGKNLKIYEKSKKIEKNLERNFSRNWIQQILEEC